MMKKVVALVLTVCMLMGATCTAFSANTFYDTWRDWFGLVDMEYSLACENWSLSNGDVFGYTETSTYTNGWLVPYEIEYMKAVVNLWFDNWEHKDSMYSEGNNTSYVFSGYAVSYDCPVAYAFTTCYDTFKQGDMNFTYNEASYFCENA